MVRYIMQPYYTVTKKNTSAPISDEDFPEIIFFYVLPFFKEAVNTKSVRSCIKCSISTNFMYADKILFFFSVTLLP